MPESTRPRETVLLALAGMSPAVVTETVWALAREKEPVLPDRVIVVTTVAGKEKLENALLAAGRPGGPSPWRQLRETLGAGGRELLLDPVRVITAPDPAAGARVPLEDIRTPEANEAAADFLLETVRGLVENPDVHLIASLAGGRKTMGALLYACFTLESRIQRPEARGKRQDVRGRRSDWRLRGAGGGASRSLYGACPSGSRFATAVRKKLSCSNESADQILHGVLPPRFSWVPR
jgi:CRISPR-associated protein (TIGR02584 family)